MSAANKLISSTIIYRQPVTFHQMTISEYHKSEKTAEFIVLCRHHALSAIRKKKVTDLELKAIKHELNQELTKRNLDAAKHKGIMNFIKYYMNFENPKMMITFDKELQTLAGRTTPMGTEEYLLQKREAKGRHDEALEIARELKKEGLAIEFIAKTTKLSIKEIEEL